MLFGIFIFFRLPDYPESAGFLIPEERELPILRMEFNVSEGIANNLKYSEAKAVLCDWRLYLHISNFSKFCPFSGLSFFAPSIVSGLGYDSLMAQLMTIPPCKLE